MIGAAAGSRYAGATSATAGRARRRDRTRSAHRRRRRRRRGPAAEEFARDGGWPLIAEVTSGAHFGPNLVVAYRELLREPDFGDRVERVVVFGHPTLSREVPALVQRDGVEAIAVAPSGIEWFNPGRRVRRFERAVRTGGIRHRRRAGVARPLGAREPPARRGGPARGAPSRAASTRPDTSATSPRSAST